MDELGRGRSGAQAHRITFVVAAGVPIAIAAMATMMLRLPLLRSLLLSAIAGGLLLGAALVWYRRRRPIKPAANDPWMSVGSEPSVYRYVRILNP